MTLKSKSWVIVGHWKWRHLHWLELGCVVQW